MFSMSAIEKGEVDVEIENKEDISLTADTVVMFNPEQVHRAKFKDHETCGYYELYLSTQWCTEIQNRIFGQNLEYIDIDNNQLSSSKYYEKFLTIMRAILNDKKGLNFENLLKEFMEDIFQKNCDINYLSKDDNPYYNIVNKARQYILRNIDKNITLEKLSGYLGFSKSYIIKMFKSIYGQTPHAFIVNQKINRAKMLISTEREKKLGEIAKKSGFYDQSHFTKNFKKVYGVNPKEYKR